MPTAYPLSWPDGWARTKQPTTAQFKTTLAGALENVEDSLRRFGNDTDRKVVNVMISSNVTLGSQRPADPGVAIYFTWDDMPTVIAVDRYSRVEWNLQAIHHVLEAERTKMRHGGLNLVRAAMRGYAGLPPPGKAHSQQWPMVLGVKPDASIEEIRAAYRERAAERHPDRGGSHAAMAELNAARDAALRARESA